MTLRSQHGEGPGRHRSADAVGLEHKRTVLMDFAGGQNRRQRSSACSSGSIRVFIPARLGGLRITGMQGDADGPRPWLRVFLRNIPPSLLGGVVPMAHESEWMGLAIAALGASVWFGSAV